MPELKKKIKFIIDRFSMIYEFWRDYCNYRRWNYNNPKVVTRAAQESKMLRQTHMIEKGMSLSEPRKGFGQQKIAVLFEMMDQYLKMGYPSDGMPFQDAIIVLNAYVDMQKGLGYENAAMVEKLKTYDKYRIDGLTAGIKYDTRTNLMSNVDKPFPEFFYSRHSMRQFESKSLNIKDVEKAIKIAQKAPTACNRQASKVYLYQDKATNDALGELIAGNTGFQQEVPNYLVVTAMFLRFMTRLREIKYMLKPDCFQWLLLRHYIIMELEVVFSKMANTIRKIKKSRRFAKIFQRMSVLFCLLQLDIIKINFLMRCHYERMLRMCLL